MGQRSKKDNRVKWDKVGSGVTRDGGGRRVYMNIRERGLVE